MKKIILLAALLFVGTGCAERLHSYIEHPESFVKDPHFAEYKESLDHIERQYLNHEITYAQYLEEKQQLDDKYDYEVKERDDKIANP